MTSKYLRIETIFSKKVNLIKYQEQTYMLVKTRNLLFANFSGVSNFTMKSMLNAKKKKKRKTHLIWLKLYLIIISALEIKANKYKKLLVIQYQKLLFFLKILLFHFINFFYRSVNALSTAKKGFFKKRSKSKLHKILQNALK